jgi:hypothetical protein
MGTVSFIVGIGLPTPQKWLAATGQIVDSPEDAVRFTVRTSLSPRVELQVEMDQHELVGGLEAYLDLEEGITRTYSKLRAELEARVWGDTPPEDLDEEGQKQADELIEQAYRDDSSTTKLGLERMQQIRERVQFMAAWPHIVVDPPAGWEDLANREGLPTTIVDWIHRANNRAVDEVTQGKVRPSAS